MAEELVSIVMPLYNSVRFVKKTIESVIQQTYSNWELLVVDDGSNDGSYEFVREMAMSEPRIKLFKNDKNSGAAISRNYALRNAKGRWIAFLDADDLWEKDKLATQIDFMEQNHYGFSYTRYQQVDENGNPIGIQVSGPKCIGKHRIRVYNYIGCLTAMYDYNIVGLIQIEDLKKRNDWAIWVEVLKKTKCYYLDECLSKYTIRTTGSITNRKKSKMSLVKYHYIFYQVCFGVGKIKAAFFLAINIVAGVMRKIVYINKQKG